MPHGVVELVQSLGGRVVSSAPLVTQFAARWSGAELAGHRRAAQVLAEVAGDALRWAGAETARGAEVREVTVQRRVLDALERAGLITDEPPIVGFQEHSALPHYSVFADQTWMAFAGRSPDGEVRRVWETVRQARDAVVERLRDRWGKGNGERGRVTGAELDDVARGVIREAGYAEFFVHRTGHSIDRELHGSGPHLDNFETADTRRLIAGVGFSVEPGIYLPGRFGMRSEINVFLDETGAEVNPRVPQQDLLLV